MSGPSGRRPPLEMPHALLDWAFSAYVVLLALARDVVPARQLLLDASYDSVSYTHLRAHETGAYL
eukprot:2932895-Pyramimonas_sp.AAC.1